MSSGLPTRVLSIHSAPDFTLGLFHSIGVSTAPGRTALTRIFFSAPSRAEVRVSETSADLAAAYGATTVGIGYDHAGTLLGECVGRCSADAAGTAGHDHYFTFEQHATVPVLDLTAPPVRLLVPFVYGPCHLLSHRIRPAWLSARAGKRSVSAKRRANRGSVF